MSGLGPGDVGGERQGQSRLDSSALRGFAAHIEQGPLVAAGSSTPAATWPGRDVVSSAGVACVATRVGDRCSSLVQDGSTRSPPLSGRQGETNLRAEMQLVGGGSEGAAGASVTNLADDETGVSQTNQGSGGGVLADPEVRSDTPDVGGGHESMVGSRSGFEGDVFEHRPRRWPQVGPGIPGNVGDPQVLADLGERSVTGSWVPSTPDPRISGQGALVFDPPNQPPRAGVGRGRPGRPASCGRDG